MDDSLRKAALEYHRLPRPGKIAATATKGLINQRDLGLAYSPGVAAACDEIVVSNSLYAKLNPRWQPEFSEIEPIDAKNVGRIVGWRSKVVV